MHEFMSDFYGHPMKVMVLGYIRPELDYTSRGLSRSLLATGLVLISTLHLEALIEDIETDKNVAFRSLERPNYTRFMEDEFFQ